MGVDKTMKIIVADDDALFRTIVRKHLGELGYTVIECDSGAGVIPGIRQHHPVACLIDLVMDVKEGVETIGEIVALADRPKLIAVSSNRFYLDLAADLGADATLAKPVTPAALKAALTKLGITPDES